MVAGKKATKLLGHSKTRAGIVQRPQGRFNITRQEWSAKREKTRLVTQIEIGCVTRKTTKTKEKAIAVPSRQVLSTWPKNKNKKEK